MKTDRLDGHAAGSALAGVVGGWFLLCALALYLFQSPTMMLGRNMFHGVGLVSPTLDLTGVLVGLVAWLILAYASGYVFVKVYNQMTR